MQPIAGDISNKRRARTKLGRRDAFGFADIWHKFQFELPMEATKMKKTTDLQK
jgi:hypothetical protein